MSKSVKSGKEVLDEFFATIDSIPNVDKNIAEKLCELYQEGKFTDTNIANALNELRKVK